ncbi:hypothetical protein NOR_03388 [Metarhizium rileyi]|uniref:Uncharacterized protein n=1 Tax=Metarhizium rileyi (strain RCEF 4871) TaxID=1649241 RepID=A0A167FQB8_METRR|nr:hypothetical protein NOR_03388 [Metarhizium rileyi RCEF 4871]
MYPNTKLWAILALVSSAVASPLDKRGPSVLVGYRTVSPAQAKIYIDAGNTLVWSESRSSDQLGKGVYISPHIGEWPASEEQWDCAVLADSNVWNIMNKAWVPKAWAADTGSCKPLWWALGEKGRAEYLKELGGPTFKVSNTILLSEIEGYDLLQLLIPPQLLDPSIGLNIKVNCAEKKDEQGISTISQHGVADWVRWINVKGTVPISQGNDGQHRGQG